MIMESQKTEGWEKRLEAFIQSQADVPHEWGKNDCVSFAADAIKVMTGQDTIGWGRGRYSTKEEALTVLKGHFGMGLIKTFDRIFTEFGFHEIACLGTGDIGFVMTENIDPEASKMFDYTTLMVGVDDQGTLIGPGKQGLLLTKDYLLVKGWSL